MQIDSNFKAYLGNILSINLFSPFYVKKTLTISPISFGDNYRGEARDCSRMELIFWDNISIIGATDLVKQLF